VQHIIVSYILLCEHTTLSEIISLHVILLHAMSVQCHMAAYHLVKHCRNPLILAIARDIRDICDIGSGFVGACYGGSEEIAKQTTPSVFCV